MRKILSSKEKVPEEPNDNFLEDMKEIEWFDKNRELLANQYKNVWVAIKKGNIVTSGKTFDGVCKGLSKKETRNALIVFVSDPIDKWDHFIA